MPSAPTSWVQHLLRHYIFLILILLVSTVNSQVRRALDDKGFTSIVRPSEGLISSQTATTGQPTSTISGDSTLVTNFAGGTGRPETGYGGYPPYTKQEETSNNLVNLYFLILGAAAVVVLGALYFIRRHNKTKRVRSAERGQNALRRDLELGGWRIGINGIGRWTGPPGSRGTQGGDMEGLDERGEAPPPYTAALTGGDTVVAPAPVVVATENGEDAAGTTPVARPRLAAVRTASYGRFPLPHLPPRAATRSMDLTAYGRGGQEAGLPTYDDVTRQTVLSPTSPGTTEAAENARGSFFSRTIPRAVSTGAHSAASSTISIPHPPILGTPRSPSPSPPPSPELRSSPTPAPPPPPLFPTTQEEVSPR